MTTLYVLEDEFQMFQLQRTELVRQLEQIRSRVSNALPDGNREKVSAHSLDGTSREIEVLNQRLVVLDILMATARRVKETTSEKRVAIGKKVTVSVDGEEKILHIGGHQTPYKDRFSYDAPLIRQLLGKGVGDYIEFHSNGKTQEIEILSIQ